MFTGIIEEIGTVTKLSHEDENLVLTVKSNISSELKIDQSVSHNGICLTVTSIGNNEHTVVAIRETLAKTNLGGLKLNEGVNLERAMKLGDRLDGHIVQGHVDQTAVCTFKESQNGSWLFSFKYDDSLNNITIEKGSITVNGVSLTVVNSKKNEFSVAIIPYTYEHTTFKQIEVGDTVNLEFDVLGKYITRLHELKQE
ncbi:MULTISPECIES: riboflavin synthase [Flavobacteriaceae]|uniref:Riboflavin synthase n=1 Tax=Meridianimaribacter flavus TaxID=571115 RepID=A0ABY2G6V6_9FLAO|nr:MULTISPECIES: riboflavin synthase [Flavobacteriaceae]TDY13519.1 riboflavin synthase alpha chain [Meridianimaribacter flavus]